jgi:hypothetical protein
MRQGNYKRCGAGAASARIYRAMPDCAGRMPASQWRHPCTRRRFPVRSAQEQWMYTKQVSIFLENKKGRLADVTRILADNRINIRALSMADMADLGVLRLIVDDSARCLGVLKEHELVAQETEVVVAEIEDKPGGLHRIVDVLGRDGTSIEYMYAFCAKNRDNAIVVLKINDAGRAVETLKRNGISVLSEDVIRNL